MTWFLQCTTAEHALQEHQAGQNPKQPALGFQSPQFRALGHSELDITQPRSIEQALDLYRPDVLINAAAYTAVDKAESEPELARLVNGIAPGLLAQACASRGIGLLHVSTDYVFDGQAATPYAEDAPTGPVSAYGRSKLEGEQAILSALPSAVVLRTSWVFSQFGNNFLKTMLRLGAERAELGIVADQVGGPTYAPHIARVLLDLAARPDAPGGIYHFAGEPAVSWHDFAAEIFRQAQDCGYLARTPTLKPIPTTAYPTTAYPTPARRPANSRLGQDKLDRVLGRGNIQRSWRDGVGESLRGLAQK